jgi:hypothetical protein
MTWLPLPGFWTMSRAKSGERMNRTRLRRRSDGTRQVPPPQVFSYRANHPLSYEPEASARRRPSSNERLFPFRPASLQRPSEPATRLSQNFRIEIGHPDWYGEHEYIFSEAWHKNRSPATSLAEGLRHRCLGYGASRPSAKGSLAGLLRNCLLCKAYPAIRSPHPRRRPFCREKRATRQKVEP